MEAVGQLAGGIAHDFNNLLTVIEGRTHLVLKTLAPDHRARQDVTIVQQTASRAARLTQQLLAFSRRQILQPRVLDLNRVVTGFAAILERLIGEHIVLNLDLAPDLGAVRADRGHLEQVITNLCVNARDAQPSGGTLTVTTRNVERDGHLPGGVPAGSYVLLVVSDTGCGMDSVTQGHIFEPFFTTKDKGKGTGLGLSTVYGIVTQSGGYVRVASRPGEGATFEILLPRVDAAIEPEPESPATEPVGGSETILLIEDNDPVRQLARDILALHGYQVLEAHNGEGALRILESYDAPVHLVVTDIVMPEMGGREFGEHFARTGHTTNILFMSGYPGEMSIPSDAPDAGRFFLAKPFSPRTLAEKVRKALDTPPCSISMRS
jgi:CheY-like chemotaxis protein